MEFGNIVRVFIFVLFALNVAKTELDCRIQADIFFLLDNSGSIGKGNFRNIIKFVKSFPGNELKIGPNDIRIGVMSYHTFVHSEFGLDEFEDLESFRAGVRRIKYHGGSTRTYLAIRQMYRRGFSTENGARSSVAKICFVVTDGYSNHKYKTLLAADTAKKRGVIMFSIGVGHNVNMEELRGIANKPTQDYVSFPIGRDAYQFGIAAFSNDAYLEFNLNTNLNSRSLLAATDGISYRGGGTNTDDGLRLAHKSMFKSTNGDRTGAPNILVVITDGHAGDHSATVKEAKMARDAGIKLFAVGVASNVDWGEIRQIASDPDDDHVVAVSSFSKLKEKIETFTKKTPIKTEGKDKLSSRLS
ncbi:hypothetical protein KUTeg_008779 [Tegillarca granosa]|uniref:VWFA domain-containing protein n=1 Tax=Tegillarca granosa TaxID=220873 RepID=A0ABQ9FEY3_TEGGR|nr:hypothetical protein KUTeg_008779 [Tegillarca granosa]